MCLINRPVHVYFYILTQKYDDLGENKWYFFTPRDRKYRNGTRPNRAAGNGYWKATRANRCIKYIGKTFGYKKALVFYEGKSPKGKKTNWIMQEYRIIDAPPHAKRSANDLRINYYVYNLSITLVIIMSRYICIYIGYLNNGKVLYRYLYFMLVYLTLFLVLFVLVVK